LFYTTDSNVCKYPFTITFFFAPYIMTSFIL
jgi:hypothetical protein